MPIEIRDGTKEEKLMYFGDRVAELAEKMGIEAFLLLAHLEDKSLVTRMPSCEEDCQTKQECVVRVFTGASELLMEMANEVKKGSSR